jgi:hypothetical protein
MPAIASSARPILRIAAPRGGTCSVVAEVTSLLPKSTSDAARPARTSTKSAYKQGASKRNAMPTHSFSPLTTCRLPWPRPQTGHRAWRPRTWPMRAPRRRREVPCEEEVGAGTRRALCALDEGSGCTGSDQHRRSVRGCDNDDSNHDRLTPKSDSTKERTSSS